MAHVLIVGAGPAGASLALLLAQGGIEVTLLERQRDFGRVFRGEVLMPSGLEALEQMRLGNRLEAVPSRPIRCAELFMSGKSLFRGELDPADFEGRVPRAVSQSALLEAFVDEARALPGFRFERGASVKELLFENGRVVGVRARTEDGEIQFRADLIIGADGRGSIVRKASGLAVDRSDPPMDVVWCKTSCPKGQNDAEIFLGRGHLLIAYRSWDDQLQLAWVIVKGTFGELKSRGIEEWVEAMANHASPALATHLRDRVDSIDRPFLLSSASDCLASWSAPGILAIGDAAHTMSPVGGQGINLALRDAIVAANHLVPLLSDGGGSESSLRGALEEIERERRREIEPIQALQALPPRVVLSRALWGEPLRRLFGSLTRFPPAGPLFARGFSRFAFGATRVRREC